MFKFSSYANFIMKSVGLKFFLDTLVLIGKREMSLNSKKITLLSCFGFSDATLEIVIFSTKTSRINNSVNFQSSRTKSCTVID